VTPFTVRDETGRNAELRDRILGILDTVAPHVAETTGLSLPAEVRYRLLTPKAWRKEFRQNYDRVLARDITELELTPAEIDGIRAELKVVGIVPILVWPLMLANTQRAADGQRETIIAPKTWRHAGLLADEPALHQVVAHELVHHLQAEARSGAVWKTFFPGKRGMGKIPPTSFAFVLEGHADWTDRQVTTRLFGTPADHRQAPKSRRYRLHDGLPGIRRLGPSREAYEHGGVLLERAVEAHGSHTINRIWKDLSLLPTEEEIRDGDSWIARIAV